MIKKKGLFVKLSILAMAFFVSGFWFFNGCTTRQLVTKHNFSGPPPEGRITVMAYNVENLFDSQKDPDREDFTYLPLSEKKKPEVQAYCRSQSGYRGKECLETNWDEHAVAQKIRAIRSGVLQIYGQGPDILILSEVENQRILNQLNKQGLPEANYQTSVLIEGDDRRGIDVGLLSRFPLAGTPQLHRIRFTRPSANPSWEAPRTRGILDVPLRLPSGETLHVLGLHFPSQANPHQERVDAVQTLVEILEAKGPEALWVVGGDWNITSREDDESGLISKTMAEKGLVSHLVGCQGCKGTHNFKGLWSYLDILVFSKNFEKPSASHYQLDRDSIWTPSGSPLQMEASGKPARFDLSREIGISDHLPIYGELKQVKKSN